MEDRNQRDNHDHGHDNDNERGGKAIAPAPKGVALGSTSLTKLSAALSNVVRSATVGRSSKPIVSFRSREEGIWTIGQRGTIVEDGSTVAVNLNSFLHGLICFSDNNEVLGEHLVPADQPKPLVTELPNHGFPWQEQFSVDMKFITGADAGAEVVYKPTTLGGKGALLGLINAWLNRVHGDQHDGKTVPVVRLGRDSYPHQKYGRVWIPVLTVVDWITMDGPAPVPADGGGREPPREPPTSPPPAEQPRRRRVA